MEAFNTACEEPASVQEAVLKQLLATHRDVDLLKRNGVEVPSDWIGAAAGGETSVAATAGKSATAATTASSTTSSTPTPLELLYKLPLTDYSAYEPAIEEALAAGRAGDDAGFAAAMARVAGLTPYSFWCSSGTTGGQKRVPASQEASLSNIKAFGMFMKCTAAAFPTSMAGKDLRFSFACEVESMPNGVKVGVASSINYRRMIASDNNDPMIARAMARWTSPKEVIIAGDAATCYYLHWLCAMLCRQEITVLSDIFAASLLLASNILIDHWPQLMADLRAGRCFSWLPADGSEGNNSEGRGRRLPAPPADVAAAVDAVLTPSAELADELQKVFDGGRHGLLERLFPACCHVNCVLTGSMSKYTPHLRELLPTVPFLSSAYGATEGFFAIQADLLHYWEAAQAAKAVGEELSSYADFPRDPDGQSSYVLMPTTDCYMEFIPYEHAEQAQPPTVSIGEVEVGRRYELVVSNLLGFFRYRMGDILRCVGHYHNTPKVLVEGRSGQALNLVGEKTPEAALVAAVAAAAEQVLPEGAPGLREWAAREVLHAGTGGDTAGHYVAYAELVGAPPAGNGSASGVTNSSSSNVHGLPSAEDLAAFASALDASLGETSPDYRVFRAGSVSGLELRLVGAGAFEDIRQLAYRMGATAAQYKPPVTVNKPAQWQLLEQHVLASAVCP